MRKVVSFQEFFYNCPNFTDDTDINNGYGCKHESAYEKAESENIGKCFCFSCPIGIEADAEDCDNSEVDLDGITREEIAEAEGNSEYLLVNEEETEALYAYERYIHRYDKKWLDEHGIENSLCSNLTGFR